MPSPAGTSASTRLRTVPPGAVAAAVVAVAVVAVAAVIDPAADTAPTPEEATVVRAAEDAEVRARAAIPATEVTDSELKAAVEVLDHVDEWVYDDNPPHTYCPSCLWDSRKDQKSHADGLSHKPDCRLRAALGLVRERFGL